MKSVMMAVAFFAPMVLLAQEKWKGEQSFTIQGTVTALQKPAKVYLNIRRCGDNKLDSTEVKDGKFSFSGVLAEATIANLLLKVQEPPVQKDSQEAPAVDKNDVLTLFLDKGDITITTEDSICKATVKGSVANDDYHRLNGQLKDVNTRLDDLERQYRQLYMAEDEEGMKKLEPQFDELAAQQKQVMRDFLKNNSNSPIAIYVLNKYADYDINLAEIEPMFNKLGKNIRNTPGGKDFASGLEAAKKTAVGQPALDFAQPDADGRNVSLAAYKGKYVLIGFWASWCGPCRAENPNVLKAYSRFRDKGFDVLSVSLDDKREKWLAAIQADNLQWTQVSDLKGWKNDVAEKYGIRAIPQNLLIDPRGNIIAKNLRGDALEKKLEEVFKVEVAGK
ncbi:TlpA disulfide reductase family protein [Chitinophaga filiformis]|uniref:AhpC/TSA family protein n=1 Tax=Chitinophaga filiformis TaxID=104663 RepID=A0ABY4I7U8_CHIFI|nr:TlpA disulfide reductase family protein [Chitinophaga filiformis]UPK71439.1 AhpC/TSA family protein [Chitinophaga filiformis]